MRGLKKTRISPSYSIVENRANKGIAARVERRTNEVGERNETHVPTAREVYGVQQLRVHVLG
jgi:hypothetical protein